MSEEIGRIQKLPLREIWRHEAQDFTTWLQENIDVVNDLVGFNLSDIKREQSAGSFNIDLVAEDNSGNTVIIENQLEKSDHKHLGQLITYLVAIEAKKAIWIVQEPRAEHINAVTWLNESTLADFYLIKVEAIKIGDSAPAPLLTLIAEPPSDEIKDVVSAKANIPERNKLRYRFWEVLLNKAKQKHSLFNSISPNGYNWIGATLGGVSYQYWVTQNTVRILLYIDRGKESSDENINIFNTLKTNKEEIERKFGDSLEWINSENNRACSIRKMYSTGGYKSEESEWDAIQEEAINGMIKLEQALKDYIKEI